jgi:hypothetical protein
MAKTVFAMITLLDDRDAIDPGFGNRPGAIDPGYDRPIHHPGHPDHGLPSRPDHIGGGPIYHPGHPDHGLPSRPDHAWGGGRPDRPEQGLPWAPGHPDAGLPVPPGLPPLPAPPAQIANKVVVLWHLPGQTEWHGKVIDPSLEGGTPLPPAPAPKG